MPTEILDIISLNSANIDTDHELLLGKLRMKCHRKKERSTTIEKCHIESFENESTKLLYKQRLQKNIYEILILNEDSIDDGWKKIKNNICAAAEDALGERETSINKTHSYRTTWYLPEVKNITKEKKAENELLRQQLQNQQPTPV